ncbi:MAG: hypothetical protein WCD86_03250 [Ktedonobacteraceae bacterium]
MIGVIMQTIYFIQDYRERREREQAARRAAHDEEMNTMEDQAQETRTLWMLVCDAEHFSENVPIYATSEEDARQRAEIWLKKQQETRRITFDELRHCPDGFRLGRSMLPGTL